jgi:hypothetical protein
MERIEDMKHPLAHALFVPALTLALVSCGSDNATSPSQSTVPKLHLSGGERQPIVAASLLVPVSTGSFYAGVGQLVPFVVTFPQAGLYQIAADWSSSFNDMDIYLTSTDCSSEAMLRAGLCTNLTYAKDDGYGKPAVVTVVTSGAATAYLWVYNLGPTGDSGIVLLSIAQ